MKSGQLCAVKLLPKLLSNGDGRAVLESDVPAAVLPLDVVVDGATLVVDCADAVVDVASAVDAFDVVVSSDEKGSPFCRRSRYGSRRGSSGPDKISASYCGAGHATDPGGGLRSTRMVPESASSARAAAR
jgi:hypothetical protein